MIVKLTGDFATTTGRREVEIYGPTTIKSLLGALDNHLQYIVTKVVVGPSLFS